MTGGSAAHGLISANIIRELGNAFKGTPCRVYSSDFKVKVGADSYYPDVSVACEKIQTTDRYTESPALLVEVLSPSTAHQDIGYKLHRYQAISTLRVYLIVSQDEKRIVAHVREAQDWTVVTAFYEDELVIAPFDVVLSLREVYRGVELE
ncbi:MAG: Uma2 family endonuclease [Gammaproteobacteria bacterium]